MIVDYLGSFILSTFRNLLYLIKSLCTLINVQNYKYCIIVVIKMIKFNTLKWRWCIIWDMFVKLKDYHITVRNPDDGDKTLKQI